MKAYSIGREMGCDIVINDSTDVISRRHATLNVYPTGKMTIIDMSQNGTYVNGIKISPNVPVPVTRKDNISFAHIARLDWNCVPNTQTKILRFAALGAIALLVVFGGVYGIKAIGGDKEPEKPATVVTDSIGSEARKKAIQEEEQRKQDSIKNHVKDSLKKANAKQGKVKTKKPADKKPADKQPKKETKEKKTEEQPDRII